MDPFILKITGYFALLAAIVWLQIRNDSVRCFSLALLEIVSKRSDEDIKNDRPWNWRYRCFENVSYLRILLSFKPLKAENFYGDTSFLQEGGQ